MSDIVFICLLAGVLVFLYGAFITFPRWFGRSVGRHRLWQLRDAIVDDVVAGRLPNDHPAVQHLVRRAELAVRSREPTMLDLLVFARQMKRRPSVREQLEHRMVLPSLDGLSPDARSIVERQRNELKIQMVGALLLGSWLGMAFIYWVFFPMLLHRMLVQRFRSPRVASTAVEATDRAASETLARERFPVNAAMGDYWERARRRPRHSGRRGDGHLMTTVH